MSSQIHLIRTEGGILLLALYQLNPLETNLLWVLVDESAYWMRNSQRFLSRRSAKACATGRATLSLPVPRHAASQGRVPKEVNLKSRCGPFV